ncbi:Tex family protein [Longibaculum muris]|uniref:Tex family protein n=1 Tax=Longibaculum muris TaxID=1796628 RepID=UPI0022E4FA5B|nr:Tex family protein [Longibaculum muris]
MNTEIIKTMANELAISEKQIENVLSLLEEGATVPFIARYRKEKTGGLNEDQIREISKVYEYQVNLQQRKEDVIRLIDEKGLLTEELKNNILKAQKLSEVEDYYRPFKEKKKTKASIAKAKGLEPFALSILKLPREFHLELEAQKYLTEEVLTIEDAIQGAKDIIAEQISDEARYRKYTKDMIYKTGLMTTHVKKKNPDEDGVYQMYYEYQEKVQYIASHRILAINRAEKEKVLTVAIEIDQERFMTYIYNGVMRKRESTLSELIMECVKDAFKRLIFPSVEREVRSELTEKAQEQALKVFSINLEKLLLQAPLKDRYVLGVDPAFRTGCKLAAIDPTGKVLDINKVFITLPKADYSKDEKVLLSMIQKYKIEIIAIGNGTASRETESFIAEFIKKYQLNVQYVIVSEAGASVYSASGIAKEEFPTYQVEERSAVSIARRLQDPLAELVKIEPKAISVGQYQHDMNQKKLTEQLDFVVEKVVNQVGVNINTASPSLLQYVSGLSMSLAKNIVKYREENGKFTSREQIKNVSKLGDKTYELSVGFLRILAGQEKFDETSIHPDNYQDASRLLQYLHLTKEDIGTSSAKEQIKKLNREQAQIELGLDEYLFNDLLDAFVSPHRSPRDEYNAPILRQDVLKIDDLKVGMKLQGVVRNVVDFGSFVDIGLKNDGLVHISKMAHHKVQHALDVCNVGDIVDVYVYEIDLKRKRVALSMIENA